jgi:PST family polysaccharide transporter
MVIPPSGSGVRPETASPQGRDVANLTTRVVRGAGLIGAGHLLAQAITFVSYVVLAHLAGPHVFGTIAAGWTIVGASSFVAESGMSSAIIQRRDRVDEAASTALVAALAAGVGLSLLALAVSPVVGLYFHDREVGLVAAALAGILLLDAAAVVPDALLRRRFSFLRRGVVDPLEALSFGLVGATLLSFGMGVWGLVIATYVSAAIRVVSVWVFSRWRPRRRGVSFAMWRELVHYGRHIAVSEFLRQVNGILNAALLGRFLGLAPLGEYRFGWRMASQAAVPVTSAGVYVLFPAFARIADEPERFRTAFLRSLRLFAVLVVPVSFALAPLGEQIAVAFLGERWRAAGHVLMALAGVTAMQPLITLSIEVFKAANRPRLVPRTTLALTAGMALATAALLPLGITGIALGISAAYVATGSYALTNVARVLGLKKRNILAQLTPPALAAGAMAVIVVLAARLALDTRGEPTTVRLGWLAAEIALAFIVYAVALRILAPSTVREFIGMLRVSFGRRRPVHAQ